MNFIHTENIEFSWGTKQILKRVSIDVKRENLSESLVRMEVEKVLF